MNAVLAASVRRHLGTGLTRMHSLTRCFTASDVCQKFPKIYTRTGDKGTSALFTGERRPKHDSVFEALGDTDELSCTVGLAAEFCVDAHLPIIDRLHTIQCVLQDIGSCVATPTDTARQSHKEQTKFNSGHVRDLELWIDEYTEELPPLSNFILPSGGKASSSLHLCRAVCRRAERSVVAATKSNDIDPEPAKYLNRLSDFLFTAARFAALREGREEKIYTRPDQRETTS